MEQSGELDGKICAADPELLARVDVDGPLAGRWGRRLLRELLWQGCCRARVLDHHVRVRFEREALRGRAVIEPGVEFLQLDAQVALSRAPVRVDLGLGRGHRDDLT